MKNNKSILFEPFQLKEIELKNRLVMAPMHTKFASESGEVTDRMISYLVERARGGVGLIVLENTCIDWLYGRAAGNPVTIHDDLCRSGLSNIALAVHRYGTKIVTQLHHTGRQNLRSNIGGGLQPVAPSVVKSHIGGDEPRALEEFEIEEIIQMYVDGARRTKDAGFDGVELHGAHGYILTQFFSPYTNRRTDKWGGSLIKRARFPVEVVRRIRTEVGKDFPILYRLSAEERIPGGTTLEHTLKLVKLLEEAGVDCFDVTAGIYDSIEWIYTLQGVAPGSLIPLAEAVKKVTTKPVIGVSRLGWDLGFAEKIVQEGKVDLVAVGRSLLADPYLPKKYYMGITDEIAPCIACNECVAMENKGWQMHCVVNPMLGSEYLDPIKPAVQSQNVLIIGGGPAGMQCAATAARRGHKVTLVEKAETLGGQLVAAAAVKYKSEEINALIGYQINQLKKYNVEVLTGIEIKEPDDIDFKPDVTILALGSNPFCLDIPGSENIINAYDLLISHKNDVGSNVVIVGASGVGIDTALYLTEDNKRKVTVVEMNDTIGGDVNEFLFRHTMSMAKEKEIKFLTNWTALSVEKNKITGDTLFGKQAIRCDTVIAACGFIPLTGKELKQKFEQIDSEVYIIGSAVKAGTIFEATQSGFWTGIEL